MRKKYETFNYDCKVVTNRDGLINAIKTKEPAIIFDTNIDKALNLTIKNSEKVEKRKIISFLSMFGSMFLTIINPLFLLTFLGGAVGSVVGKDELKKYITYKMNIDGSSYILLLHKKVDLTLDSIFYNGKKIK